MNFLSPVLLVASLLVLSSSVTAQKTVRLSEPVASDASSETFGTVWDATLEPKPLAEVLADVDAHAGKPLLVRTTIARVCQKKGCFFIAQDGVQAVRVSFRDYGFFIPTDAGGKDVLLAGELVRKHVPEQQAEHFRADLGDAAAPVAAGDVVELIADGIRIPR
ncbi:MAG: DUF4920 domain-containing protein [Pseudomonadales bacterium]